MKILNAVQLKEVDNYTIENEPVSSVNLMERAGKEIYNAIRHQYFSNDSYLIFCGPGNNGGDGLVLARLFHLSGNGVEVIILKGKYSQEFLFNFQKIKDLKIKYTEIENQFQIDAFEYSEHHCFIDALFGIGITRHLEGLVCSLIKRINALPNFTIAIDLPSGLSPDALFPSTPENTIMADFTFTIQLPKLSFFFSENHPFTGDFNCIDIGLSKKNIEDQLTPFYYSVEEDIHKIIKPRAATGYKNTFGHTLIIAGGEGKNGASVLCSKAALRSGCGLITASIPSTAVIPLLNYLPEAMTLKRDNAEDFLKIDLSQYQSLGFGPGVGVETESAEILFYLLHNFKKPMVLDADALTLLSINKDLYPLLSPDMILTPHPGEFDRLTKKHTSGFERFKAQIEFTKTYHVNILLKGPHTSISTTSGFVFFNSTGNNGMATAGSGDVLTGIITSLCAQGYNPQDACILGAYLHGYAGDKAASKLSKTSLIASDIIASVPDFFVAFEK